MNLDVEINHVKAINNFKISLPLEHGLYAITGQNGAGKSTVVTCAATVFYNMAMHRYFKGSVNDGSFIKLNIGETERRWDFINSSWIQSTKKNMQVKGYYEGSLIFGNRFRDTTKEGLAKLDYVQDTDLVPGSEFIRKNLGYLLNNNENYFDKLWKIDQKKAHEDYGFKGEPHFYDKGGKRVSQMHMSTGESLLLSILYSLQLRLNSRSEFDIPCIIFLDEVELALHPSALARLVIFLRKISNDANLAVYFSTHSIELIKDIDPTNIFYLERHVDDTIEIVNPCYPSYATRNLYEHTGYDFVILVEDDMAKAVIIYLLKKYRLLSNRLVHVLPCGGWQNVLKLADEVVDSNLIASTTNIFVILDGDVEKKSKKFIQDKSLKFSIPVNYLPVQSLEKYLKDKLFDNVDHVLFRTLNDYIFHRKSLTDIIDSYRNKGSFKDDDNGKALYKLIETELKNRNVTRTEFIDVIVDHLEKNNTAELDRIKFFLEKQIK